MPYCANCGEITDRYSGRCPKPSKPVQQPVKPVTAVKTVTAETRKRSPVTAGTKGTPVTAETRRVHNCPYCQCERRVHQSNAEKQKAYRDRLKSGAARSSVDDDWE